MPIKVIVLLVGTLLVPLAKLVGLLAESSWPQTWGYAAAAAFALAFVMYPGFRQRVLTHGVDAMKALSKMGGAK